MAYFNLDELEIKGASIITYWPPMTLHPSVVLTSTHTRKISRTQPVQNWKRWKHKQLFWPKQTWTIPLYHHPSSSLQRELAVQPPNHYLVMVCLKKICFIFTSQLQGFWHFFFINARTWRKGVVHLGQMTTSWRGSNVKDRVMSFECWGIW